MEKDARPSNRIILQLLLIGLAAIWFGAMQAFIARPLLGFSAVFVAGIIILGWVFGARHRVISSWSYRLGVVLVLLSSLLAMIFLGENGQQYMAWGSAILLLIYLQQATEHTPTLLQGRITTFVMTVTMWLLVWSFLNWAVFVNGRWWQVVLGGVLAVTAVSIVVWLELGIAWQKFRSTLPAMVWLGGALLLTIWWLPTAVVVSSTVATVMIMLFIHIIRYVWIGDWQPRRGHRYLLIGGIIIATTLLTARWV